jgi:hypothetical protein
MDWTRLAQHRDQWWAFVNTVMMTAVPQLRWLVAGFSPRRLVFDPRSDDVGSVVDKVALGQVFLLVLRFPMPVLIPPNAPYSSVIRDWYNRPISGQSTKWTQSHPHPHEIKKNMITNLWVA